MIHYCIIHASFQALFYQATRIKKPPEGGPKTGNKLIELGDFLASCSFDYLSSQLFN
jgi:hypothetical protein